jgi:hypothetical protein
MHDGADDWNVPFFPSIFSDRNWRQYVGDYEEASEGGGGAYLMFHACGYYAEFYIDNVSIREIVDPPEPKLAAWRDTFPDAEFVCWKKSSPWAHLKKLSTPSVGLTPCRRIQAAMGTSEYESASFVLTNLTDKDLTFSISTSPIPIDVTIRQAIWVRAYNGTLVNDALPLLEGDLVLPPGENREVWLTLRTNGAQPGNHKTDIAITSSGQEVWKIGLSVDVHDAAIPDELPLYTYYWDHIAPEWQSAELCEAMAKDLKAHYTNVAWVHPSFVPPMKTDSSGRLDPDYKLLDDSIDAHAHMTPKMRIFFWNADAFQLGAEYAGPHKISEKLMDPKWRALFREWIKDWVRHMAERGIGYDSFAMCPIDERMGEITYELAKLIKETDPNILFYVNATGQSFWDVKRIAPYIDIWCPYYWDYMNHAPYADRHWIKATCMQEIKVRDEFFWTYANPLNAYAHPTASPGNSPYWEYRLAVWRAWKENMRGFGYWVYSSHSRWDSYKKGVNWAVVYFANADDAPDGLSKTELVIPSKRWEATREGIEDYVYLYMLREAIDQTAESAARDPIERGEKILDEWPKRVLRNANNEDMADQAKLAILKTLVELSAISK